MTDDSFVLSPPVLPRPLLIEQIYLSIYIVFNIYIIIYNKLFYIHILSLRGEGPLFETVICHLSSSEILRFDLRPKIDATDLLSSSNATRDGSCKHDSPLAALSVRDSSCKHDSPLLPRFCVLPGKS